MKLKNKEIEEISKKLRRMKEIKFAYLFGSAATGKMGNLSDIDIAIYLDKFLPKDKILDIHLKVIHEVSSVLQNDNIDVVVMNESNASINYSIICDGIKLKDNKERIDAEYMIMKEYLDRKYYEDLEAEIFLKRVAEKGLV